MRCPFCKADDTRVVDSRPAEGGATIRRRRECAECENRFTTYERREPSLLVHKRDGRIEPFSPAKVLTGLRYALADRPIGPGALDDMVRAVELWAHEQGPEVSSDDVGRQVLLQLRRVDEVAYLRFASVYKEFEGPDDFEREMAALESDS